MLYFIVALFKSSRVVFILHCVESTEPGVVLPVSAAFDLEQFMASGPVFSSLKWEEC